MGRKGYPAGHDLESTVTLEPRTSTQCWPCHTSPAQCSEHDNYTYCTPTLGRLEKVLLQSSTNVKGWEDLLQYESFCKAYFQELEPKQNIFRYYQKLIQASQFANLFNIKWFSLHSTHSIYGNASHIFIHTKFFNSENQLQQILRQFDGQNNFTMEMIKNYEYYQMHARHSAPLSLRMMDQLESITDENARIRLSQTLTAARNQARTAEKSQVWTKTIIKRHLQTLRSNLER